MPGEAAHTAVESLAVPARMPTLVIVDVCDLLCKVAMHQIPVQHYMWSAPQSVLQNKLIWCADAYSAVGAHYNTA